MSSTPWVRHMPRVAVLPWPGIDGAYLCVSGQWTKRQLAGERWYDGHEEKRDKYAVEPRCKPRMTFLFDAGSCCAEWDGDCGPVQLWSRCEADFEEGYDKARPHWFYPHAFGSGHWSQRAVEEDGLPEAFTRGDYAHIFDVLARWARR